MSNVQSIKRAFELLNTIAANPNGLTVTKVAQQVNLPKSTVSRLLLTLESSGAVERISNREGFRIGTGIFTLASQASYPRYLSSIVRPFLLKLAQATGETINLCIPDGNFAHYIDQVNGQYNLQIRNWTGYRIPVHASCDGKLFLAHWPDDKIEEYLSRPLQNFSANTLTDPDKLRSHLAGIRAQGHSRTNGEYEIGIVGISVPIWGQDEQMIASLCVGGPAFRFPPEGEADNIIALMKDATRKIAARL